MNTLKKLWMGLASLLIAVLAWTIFSPTQASAVFTDAQIQGMKFHFTDEKHIIGTTADGKEVTFSGAGVGGFGTYPTYYSAADNNIFCKLPSDPLRAGPAYPTVQVTINTDYYRDPVAANLVSTSEKYTLFAGTSEANCHQVQPTTKEHIKLSGKPAAPTGTGSAYTKAVFNNAKAKFTDGAHIEITFPAPVSKTVTFQDNNPEDGTHKFGPADAIYCGNNKGYLALNSKDMTDDSFKATLSGYYYDLSTLKYTCREYQATITIDNPKTTAGDASAPIATQIFKYDVDGSNNVMTTLTGSLKLIQEKNNGSLFVKDTSDPEGCGGGWVVELTKENLGKLIHNPNDSNFSNCHSGSTSTMPVLILGIKGSPAAGTGSANVSSNQDSSACVFAGDQGVDVALEWILCPIITGMSKSADFLNSFVEGQLNFNVKDNLTGDVHRAWTVFKNLVTVILVIIMLIMVISQAVSSGSFMEAYTVRKLLPRLVVAIILMQASWALCIYAIGIANDAGQGIAQLMQAPFGGGGNLDLPSLIHRLNPVYGAVTGVLSYGSIIGAIIFGKALILYGWPLLLLAVILILLALIAAMATLLLRNALIVILVMLAPLAFVAWVLPGTQDLWKKWKNNFIKLLVFFPAVMALIYGGRIFAYVAAGLGNAGPLDLLMVLLGFFGPYFFLPKTFKWGGDWLAAGSKMINESWPLKKGREVANRELLTGEDSAMKRRLGHHAAEYADITDPLKPEISDSRWKRFGHSVLAGRFIPTKRAQATMIARGNAFKEKENQLNQAIASRRREKGAARTNNVGYGKGMDMRTIEDGFAKAAEAEESGNEYRQKDYERVVKEAIRDLIATGSTLELNGMTVSVPLRDATSGELMRDSSGKLLTNKTKVWKTKLWRDLLNGSPDLYREIKRQAPDWVPHRTPTGLPKYRGEFDEDEFRRNKAGELANQLRSDGSHYTPEQVEAEVNRLVEERKNDPRNIFLRTAGGHPEYVDDVQWAESLHETVTELDAQGLASLHPTYYERIGDAAKEGQELMKKAEATNDEGLKKVAVQLIRPAEEFGQTISRLARDQGSRHTLGAIMGGADTMKHLDYALQYSKAEGVNAAEGDNYEENTRGHGSMEAIIQLGAAKEAQARQAAITTPEGTIRMQAGAEQTAVIQHSQPSQVSSRPPEVFPGQVVSPITARASGEPQPLPGSGQISHGTETTLRQAAEAMTEAAEQMRGASREVRRSAVAQAQVARRLGGTPGQRPGTPQPENSGDDDQPEPGGSS